MAHYVVTGGCGFIGKYLVDRLISHYHQVTVIDNITSGTTEGLNPKAILVTGDICDKNKVEPILHKSDGCFHLAAVASVQETIDKWVHSHETNVTGTITLLDIAKDINQQRRYPIIYASSAAVFGDHRESILTEDSPLNPISPYGVDKLVSEMHAQLAYHLHKVPNIGLRLFNVYGKKPSCHNQEDVISIFQEKIKNNDTITIYGDGQQERDFIYVEDVVTHFTQAMSMIKIQSDIFNVCTNQGTKIIKLARMMASLLGKELNMDYQSSRPGEIMRSIGQNHKAQSHLCIRHYTSLNIGLQKMLFE